MFKAKMNLGLLIECIEAITGVVDDGVVNITKDGWDIRVVDPANVAMVSLKLQSDVFDSFEFESPDGEDRLKVGIDFSSLLEVLRLWSEEIVKLELDENAENMRIKSDVFDCSVSLSDPSVLREEPKRLDLAFPVRADIGTKRFIDAILALERVADDDYAIIGVKKGELYIRAEGERHKLKVVLGEQSDTKDMSTQHNLDYLSGMCKGMHTDTLTLSLGHDYPIQIDFSIAHGKGEVSYLLAPRIPPD